MQVDVGHGLLLGGDEGDRDGGKVQVDDGHGLLLGRDEGDRDGGKVQVDDGHGLLLGRDEGALTGNICMGSMQVEARCVCRIHGTFSRQSRTPKAFFWRTQEGNLVRDAIKAQEPLRSAQTREYVEMGMREERKCILWSAREVGLI